MAEQQNMDIKNMSLDQLKVMYFDMVKNMETNQQKLCPNCQGIMQTLSVNQQNLQLVEQEISNREGNKQQ